ncbi:MAG: DNA/RNA non-specific endonuclease [Pyrinomonadaceae bacterium]|nr:DNA/RNA non-specific endonuclease [Pyrinomonadaceae bacterium]
MARNSRTFGLTPRQITSLLKNRAVVGLLIVVAIIAAIIFGCRACYNYVANDNSNSTVSNNNGSAPRGNDDKKQPRSGSTAKLSNAEATELYLKTGNPSNASQADANNYLMVNPYFALSYNREKAIPNWVAWTITQSDLGTGDRQNDFRPDERLPNGWVRIATNDYTGSGFDRGHICPSADRNANPEANSATFLMTNMTPQTPDLNRSVWERLESYSRDLVKKGNELYVISGVYGDKGKIKNKITIPTNNWKVIVVMPNGVGDISQINKDTRVIAVDMPNAAGIKNDDWRKYLTTVRNIEGKTGLNLLSNIPQNVQETLETRVDNK